MFTRLTFFTFLFFLLGTNGFAQSVSDTEFILKKPLIAKNEFAYYKREGNDKKILETHSKTLIAKMNPLSIVSKAAMSVYQNVLSPQLSKTCAYDITCSNFSKQAIEKFGLIKGVFLSADRLMRCNRIALLDIHKQDINPKTGAIQDPISNY